MGITVTTLTGIHLFGMIHFIIGIGVQLLTCIIHHITTLMHIHHGITADITMGIIHIIIMDTMDIGATIHIQDINIDQAVDIGQEIMMV